jgi:hypothetical protein
MRKTWRWQLAADATALTLLACDRQRVRHRQGTVADLLGRREDGVTRRRVSGVSEDARVARAGG